MDRELRIGAEWREIHTAVEAEGHQHCHYMALPEHTVHYSWDHDSILLSIRLDEYAATQLYWWLLEVVPALRKDRG